jgi:hypothetical protein
LALEATNFLSALSNAVVPVNEMLLPEKDI